MADMHRDREPFHFTERAVAPLGWHIICINRPDDLRVERCHDIEGVIVNLKGEVKAWILVGKPEFIFGENGSIKWWHHEFNVVGVY